MFLKIVKYSNSGFMKNFNIILINWYHQHKRTLPWRDITDPYRIWISEIILQQTRVAQGYAYYQRFIERFPDVASLASAQEEEVLKYWQGLGYYTRARNLYAAAKSMNGVFPSTYEGIRALKGVGDYAAAAIASFAFNMPYAVVDGNVYRVLARIFGISDPIDGTIGKKKFAALAQELLDKKDPGTYNQAIMELGALQCVPVSPDCTKCPFMKVCKACQDGKVSVLPVKKHKTKTRNRYFHYLYIDSGRTTFLHKRGGKDIWENLYELPLIELEAAADAQELSKTKEFQALFKTLPKLPVPRLLGKPKKHILSHQVIYASFFEVKLSPGATLSPAYKKIQKSDIYQYAVSRLVHAFLEEQD